MTNAHSKAHSGKECKPRRRFAAGRSGEGSESGSGIRGRAPLCYTEGMKRIRGIVFDFGGVISLPPEPSFYESIAALAGWSRETLLAGWRRHRSGMDADFISIRELYRRIAADLGQCLSAATQDALAKADFDAWVRPNPETLAWARELKAAGLRVGILTNMPTAFLPWFDRCAAAFRALADAEVVSGAEHLVKPGEAIYRLMERRIGLPPEALCFFDDTQANVDAARALGWRAERFVSAAQARAALEAMA